MLPTIVFDIDGTLACLNHRLHYIRQETPDWDSFHMNSDKDTPIDSVVFLYKALKSSPLAKDVVFALLTGRPEKSRQITEKWLADQGLDHDVLLMRKNHDFRKDAVIKKEMLDGLQNSDHVVILSVEDRKQVVDMWRENEIMCLQCAEGNY